MSLLTYGDVSLPLTTTTSFDCKARSDDSGTDLMLFDYDLAVTSLVAPEYLPMIFPNALASSAGNPATIMKMVRARLMTRRKRLTFTFNGIDALPAFIPETDSGVDADNGPIPMHCQCIDMENGSWMISYRIRASYWDRPQNQASQGNQVIYSGNDQTPSPVLNNRWSETVSLDRRQYSTKVRTGKIRIRSDNVQGFTPDMLRSQFCVLSLPEGFLRESSEYTVTPDGLCLQYTIRDREQHRMPPEPAFEAPEAYYSEDCGRMGAFRHGECLVSLAGDKITSAASLIKTAVGVAITKLVDNGATTKANQLNLMAGRIRQELYENRVTVYFRALLPPTKKRLDRTLLGGFNTRVRGSTGTSPVPPYLDRGTASMLLQAAAYYDPNLGRELGSGPVTSPTNPLTDTGRRKVQTRGGVQPGQAVIRPSDAEPVE